MYRAGIVWRLHCLCVLTVFCEAGAPPGGRKSPLYFDVSVSGRHIAYRSKFWKARRQKGFQIDLHLRDLTYSNHIGHHG